MKYVTRDDGTLSFPSMVRLRREGYAGRAPAEVPDVVLDADGYLMPASLASPEEIDAYLEGPPNQVARQWELATRAAEPRNQNRGRSRSYGATAETKEITG